MADADLDRLRRLSQEVKNALATDAAALAATAARLAQEHLPAWIEAIENGFKHKETVLWFRHIDETERSFLGLGPSRRIYRWKKRDRDSAPQIDLTALFSALADPPGGILTAFWR